MYRFLGFFWLLMSIGLLVLPNIYPELAEHPMTANVVANNVPVAAFCFALSGYNMIRWRLIRANEIAREKEMEHEFRRRSANRPIDPTFDFSDPKPPASDEKPKS